MLPCGADEVTVRATSGRRTSVADSLATSDDARVRVQTRREKEAEAAAELNKGQALAGSSESCF